MPHLEETVLIHRPPALVYAAWNHYEDLPKILKGVRRVQRVDDRHFVWTADVAGRQARWVAEVVEDQEGHLVGWQSISGSRNAGRLLFEPDGARRTRLRLNLVYEPETLTQEVASGLGFVRRRVRRDLRAFRRHLEANAFPPPPPENPAANSPKPAPVEQAPHRGNPRLETAPPRPRP